jgi:hypothetical protein
MLIREHLFRGQIPAAAVQHLPTEAAQISKNAVREKGNIRPLKDTLFVATPAKVGTKQAIHLFAGDTWFHWLTAVDAVRAPIPNDTQERTIFTGDGAPKVTDASIATSGGGVLYPNNSYLLGLPAPVNAPAAAVLSLDWSASAAYALGQKIVTGDYRYGATTEGTSGGTEPTWPTTVGETVADGTVVWTCESATSSGDTETTAYLETFLRRWSGIDEEGPPSPSSNLLDVQFVNGQGVDLSALNAAPEGGYNITHRRIYRVNTASESAYQFVAELPIATTTYADTILSSALGETLATEEYSEPPADLAGIRAMPNGVLVGFSGKNVCFCEPHQAHAWPTRYRLPSDFKIVGVEVFGSSVLVATEGVPYVATGALPGYMTMDRTEITQACVARRGMADLGSFVAYPSPDGLMIMGSGVAENATRALFTRDQWLALAPASFVAAAHNGKYYAFYDTGAATGCLILDLTEGSADFCDIAATAVHVDLLTDSLYVQRGDDIVKWDAGSALTLNRKGKRHSLPRPGCLTVAKVKALGYPLTFKLHAKLGSAAEATAVAAASGGALAASGDTVISTATVASAKPFRLPGGYRTEYAELEVEGNVEIEEIAAAETMSELRQI